MTPTELSTAILFILLGSAMLQGLTIFVRHWLKLDSSDREQQFQGQINELGRKVKDYEAEVINLQRQIKIIVGQYEEAIARLSELQKQYDVTMETNRQLRDQITNLSNGYVMRESRPDKVLLVLAGSDDPGLALDMATLRAVRTETGLEIQEISDPSPDRLKRALDRARMKQDHIYLHMGIRSDENGYEIGDTIVDASWLSSILNNVLVLVVAGADSDQIGDFLGVVPYVISVSGGVSSRDIAMFARVFWSEIGRGIGPSLALRRALDRSPSTIREKIISHWQD